MAITSNTANIKVAGIAKWQMKIPSDIGYREIPEMTEGKIITKILFRKDTKGREVAHTVDFMATIKIMNTGNASLINNIVKFGEPSVLHKITTTNGQTYSTALLGDTRFGGKWVFVANGDMEENRYIEYTITRRLLYSEFESLLGVPPLDGGQLSTDFFSLGTTTGKIFGYLTTDVRPSGISKIEWRDGSSSGVFTDVCDNLRKANFKAELLTTKDGKGREIGYAVAIEFSAENLQSDVSELLQLDSMHGRRNDCKITLVDNVAIMLDDKVGMIFDFNNGNDSDDISFVKITGSGKMPTSVWNGLWS